MKFFLKIQKFLVNITPRVPTVCIKCLIFHISFMSLPPTVETFLSTLIQEFIFQFATTLTTSEFLKSINQHFFQNFFLF